MSKSIIYDWHFPLPRTHTGMLLGNGTMGVMVWGGQNVLRLTIGRADFWDHCGGTAWTERMNYREIRRLLEAGDEPGIRALFSTRTHPGGPERPTVLPIGRFEVEFDASVKLKTGHLHLERGEIVIDLQRSDGTAAGQVVLNLSMDQQVLHVRLPDGLATPQVRTVTAWSECGEELAERGLPQAEVFEGPDVSGLVQARTVERDVPLCVGYRLVGGELWVTSAYGPDRQGARSAAAAALAAAQQAGGEALRAASHAWWEQYWQTVPKVKIPHERLSFLYHYGMYKVAGLSAPQGVAATLQGPWIEEYQTPPWSSDYHFNINVQMCYWPVYGGNRLSHLRPLFDMIWSWRDQMRDYAHKFVGIDDGYVLPHAVSDECITVGNFWTGTIDHACTGWVAKMMFDYYRMSGDVQFLRERAYPFMYGAMRVFEEMLEKRPDGTYMLPVSVSPEYGAATMRAWGRNASFQVGCIHMLIENLHHACEVLGEQPRAVWAEIKEHLPLACVEERGGKERIVLWEGQDLDESHRHHSHWAGLYPWDVIDLNDPKWKRIIRNTYDHWLVRGMGRWTGWCIPWAAMLHARVGCPDAAVALLEYWEHLYTNEGHGTLHDPKLPRTNLRDTSMQVVQPERKRGEVMQMDAGMSACAAVMDFLVHTRRGVHYLLQGAPIEWREVEVEGIRTEGAFLVGFSKADGQLREVRVRSEVGNVFRLSNPWSTAVVVQASGTEQVVEGAIVEVPTKAGTSIVLRPVG